MTKHFKDDMITTIYKRLCENSQTTKELKSKNAKLNGTKAESIGAIEIEK